MADYDVIVLGGGSAGTSAAAAATRAGACTLLINDGELGGLCILRGCMPTKAMLASAHGAHEANHLDPLGVRLEGRVVPDFARIMERKEAQVRRFQRAKIDSVEARDHDVLFGRGRFAPGGGVVVDGRTLTARNYVIATGSYPGSLPIPGIDTVPVLNSDDVMSLTSRPATLLVQGAGPIGLELAQFFARIGTRVHLVNRSPLLSRLDTDCGAELTRALSAELELLVPGRIESLAPLESGLTARIHTDDGPRELRADALLMATGRHAALDDLGLEHTGLAPVDGRLQHDSAMRTDNPDIYVAGDATGRYQILHLSNQEGATAGANAAGTDPPAEMDYRLEMSVIFTDPPFAMVGASERAARRAGEIVTGVARFPETGRAITMEVRHGLWKVFADRGSGEIVGSALLGPRADDLVHLISTLMYYRASATDICALPWYHPTLSEVLLTLGRDLAGQLDVTPSPGLASLPPGYLPND